MTKRKVVEDSDGEDECDVTSPTNANIVEDVLELNHSSPLRTTSRSTILSTGSSDVLNLEIQNAHKSMMEPTPKPARQSQRAKSLSQHELSVPTSTSKLKSKRAVTSIPKEILPKDVSTYGSQEGVISLSRGDVFEFRGSSDGEIEIEPPEERKRKRQKEGNESMKNVDGASSGTNPLQNTRDGPLKDTMPPPMPMPHLDDQTQHSEANTIPTIPDSTPVHNPSIETPVKSTSTEGSRPPHLSLSDGRMPTPTISSHGRTDESKSSRDVHEERELLLPPASLPDTECQIQGNRHEPTSSASIISPSRTITVPQAITKAATIQVADDLGKHESYETRASFHTAGSTRPIVLMQDPPPDLHSYDELSLPNPTIENKQCIQAHKDSKRKRANGTQDEEPGSDDISIGLPKEQYQPRPSRSRGNRNKEDLIVPEDYSKRPEVLAKPKRKNKRCKTTAFHELIPKEEEEENDEKAPPENPNLKIPEFVQISTASAQTENLEAEEIELVEEPSVQKKQRGRPKKGPEPQPAQDTINEVDELDRLPHETPKPPDTQKSSKRGRPSKKSMLIIDEGLENEEDADPRDTKHATELTASESAPDKSPGRSAPTKNVEVPDASSSPPKAMPPPATPQKMSVSPTKGPDKHSPINSGKVAYRVGLSKRARIEPLLRIVRK
ncbi:MAG: hypothetical protein Q9164_002497 [Protoblastenia rupestris]